MATTAVSVKFCWDEPPGCTTPRGWCSLSAASHPDRRCFRDTGLWSYHVDNGLLGCGNYLEYLQSRGPAGETFHAVAYTHRITSAGLMTNQRLGSSWWWTAAEAVRESSQSRKTRYIELFSVPAERSRF